MPTYILDTGMLVGYVRAAGFADYAEKKYQVSQPPSSRDDGLDQGDTF